jgi:hypothetical protein
MNGKGIEQDSMKNIKYEGTFKCGIKSGIGREETDEL